MIGGEGFKSEAKHVDPSKQETVHLVPQKPRSGGVVVKDISNRHLEVEPVVRDLAQDRGLVCYQQFDAQFGTEGERGKLPSNWVMMANKKEDLGSVVNDKRWRSCATTSDPSNVWTDDFSNILSIFKWR